MEAAQISVVLLHHAKDARRGRGGSAEWISWMGVSGPDHECAVLAVVRAPERVFSQSRPDSLSILGEVQQGNWLERRHRHLARDLPRTRKRVQMHLQQHAFAGPGKAAEHIDAVGVAPAPRWDDWAARMAAMPRSPTMAPSAARETSTRPSARFAGARRVGFSSLRGPMRVLWGIDPDPRSRNARL